MGFGQYVLSEGGMGNLVRNIVAVLVSIVSVGVGQEPIDTAKYIKETEREFILQLNQYRRTLKVDTLKTEDSLHFLCFLNNERLSKEDKILYKSFKDNKEFREIAHRGFGNRLECYYDSLVEIPILFRNTFYSEIVSYSGTDSLILQTPKKLAKQMLDGWIGSHDHNEILIDRDYETVNTTLKFIINKNNHFRFIATSVFKTKRRP